MMSKRHGQLLFKHSLASQKQQLFNHMFFFCERALPAAGKIFIKISYLKSSLHVVREAVVYLCLRWKG